MAGLLFVVVMVVCAFACAGFTALYVFSLGDPHLDGPVKRGRILSHVGIWLEHRYQVYERATLEIRSAKELAAKNERQLLRARMYTRANPYKMAGVCPRCCNVWIAALFFVGLHFVVGYSMWWLPVFIGLANRAIDFGPSR